MPKYASYIIYGLFALVIFSVIAIAYKMVGQAPAAQIYVKPAGLSKVQYQQLTNSAESLPVDSFFKADLQQIRDNAAAISWVDEVSVTRDWHKGIVIKALPRQAVARFGSENLVDAKGTVFMPADETTLFNQPYTMLQGDKEQAMAIMHQLQVVNELFLPLSLKVEDLILTPRQTWLIRFNTGMRIIVDGENTAQKLMNVSHSLQQQLSDKVDNVQVVDARYKNGFSITWR